MINPYISRCLSLARQGQYGVQANPRVGAVIVHNHQVIGEGYHQRQGEAHAEVNAVNQVQDKSLLIQSTLYVSLEPCSHYGLTPPCANLIIEHRIPRVVLSLCDPNTKVSGIDVLEKAGVEVTILEDEHSADENRIFVTNQVQQRPYIILKWAQSQDGFIDHNFKPTAISKPSFARIAHHIRATVQGIMIGKHTLKTDLPKLTTRYQMGKSPIPIVLDSQLETLDKLEYLKAFHSKIIVINSRKDAYNDGIHCLKCTSDMEQIFARLYKEGLASILVEGGAKVLNQCIAQGVWDEACRVTSPIKLTQGTVSPAFNAIAYNSYDLEGQAVEYFAQ